MNGPVYIHYGSNVFDPTRGFPIRNRKYWTKPKGGLWASRKDASWGWKDWCEEENFRVYNLKNAFEFVLRDNANVVIVSTLKQLQSLPKAPTEGLTISYCIDFEECLNRGIDAIELCWYGEEYSQVRKDNLYFELYSWDCDSIVILNPDIVIPLNT